VVITAVPERAKSSKRKHLSRGREMAGRERSREGRAPGWRSAQWVELPQLRAKVMYAAGAHGSRISPIKGPQRTHRRAAKFKRWCRRTGARAGRLLANWTRVRQPEGTRKGCLPFLGALGRTLGRRPRTAVKSLFFPAQRRDLRTPLAATQRTAHARARRFP